MEGKQLRRRVTSVTSQKTEVQELSGRVAQRREEGASLAHSCPFVGT